MIRHTLLPAVATLVLLGAAVDAEDRTTSDIGGNFFAGGSGAVAVNLSAGTLNQQANSASIGRNASGGTFAEILAAQRAEAAGEVPVVAIATIREQAFVEAAGLVVVNQASGNVNLQANGVTIAFGGGAEVVADVTLGQTRADSELPPGSETGSGAFQTAVAETAFRGAQGIVQVNQAAGSGNASANAVALRFQAGAAQ